MASIKHRALLLTGLIIIAVLVVGVNVVNSLVTYDYYGNTLSYDGVASRYNSGDDLHCVQTSNTLITVSYQCFDTLMEAQTFAISGH